MEKYIAFELYRKNEHGGHSKALHLEDKPQGAQILLVADVEHLLGEISTADDPSAAAGMALRDLMGS